MFPINIIHRFVQKLYQLQINWIFFTIMVIAIINELKTEKLL